jgi:mRNA interferase MazF
MLTSGDVVLLDLGSPTGREAGLRRPAVVVTAQAILDESANVVQVVPLTTTVRSFGSEVFVSADESNGLDADSAAQCQHVRSISVDRVESVSGNIGPASLSEVREVLALLLDIN